MHSDLNSVTVEVTQQLQMFLLAADVPTNCDVQRRLVWLLMTVASQAYAP